MVVKALRMAPGPIPLPPRPPTDDIKDRNQYINEKLSPDQKKQLVESAEQFADILEWGGWTSQYAEAAKNVDHYRHGWGSARQLTTEDVASMENEISNFKTNKNSSLSQFLDDIKSQFIAQKIESACFLAREGAGDYWIGFYAKNSKWFYAMGGFLYSFGARADIIIPNSALKGRKIKVIYKLYIYDRYNWDIDKRVPMPKRPIDRIDMATPGSIEPLKNMPFRENPSENYIYEFEDDSMEEDSDDPDANLKYSISDAVMGSLATENKAEFFDIRGESAENIVYLSMD